MTVADRIAALSEEDHSILTANVSVMVEHGVAENKATVYCLNEIETRL
jgi:hypothetical protein